MTSVQELGAARSHHRKNSALSIAMLFLGAVFLAATALLFSIADRVTPDARSLVYGTLVGVATLTVALIGAGLWMRRGGRLVLHERGICVVEAGEHRAYRFEEIAETCQKYRANLPVGVAFRSANGSWEGATAHLSGYGELRSGLMAGYVGARLPALLASLKKGDAAAFKVVTAAGKSQADRTFGILDFVKVATENALVSATAISLRGQSLDIRNIVDCQFIDDSQRMAIVLDDSTAHLTYTEFFEPELVRELLKALAAQRRQ